MLHRLKTHQHLLRIVRMHVVDTVAEEVSMAGSGQG